MLCVCQVVAQVCFDLADGVQLVLVNAAVVERQGVGSLVHSELVMSRLEEFHDIIIIKKIQYILT